MTTADDLMGKKVLVGLTYLDAAGNVRQRLQVVGVVKAINERIEIERDDGGTTLLPPDPTAFYPAEPGEYRIKDSGKVVNNPDYLCTYEITAPHDH